MIWFFFWIQIFCFISPLIGETISIIPYEPNTVHLTGILRENICPGPPEYESVEMGDMPEHIFVLCLDSPVHVRDIPPKENSWNEPEDNVSEIQVAASPRDAQHLVGKHIAITGSLFHAITAHHRTEVIMIDNQIEVLK